LDPFGFPQVPPRVCDMMYNYGKHLGLAFQVVDDILDFTQACSPYPRPPHRAGHTAVAK